MILRQVAAAVAFAFVSSSGLAAYGDSAAAGTGLVLVGWAALDDPVLAGTPALALPADARHTADARIPAGGRSVQGAGMIAAAATTQSFTRMAGGRPIGRDGVAATAAEPSEASETDTGALILAGLGVAGLLALRRNVGG